jgi:hypothetical protein
VRPSAHPAGDAVYVAGNWPGVRSRDR